MGIFLLNTIKVLIGIAFLPAVVAILVVLHKHVSQYPGSGDENNMFFLWGEEAFLIAFFFIHQFEWLYEFGQKMMQRFFQWLSPLDKVFVYVVPGYLTFIMIIFYLLKVWLKTDLYDNYFIFFAGFAFILHLVMTSKELQASEKTIIKPDYFFMMVFTIMITSCLTVLFFDLLLAKWTFPDFFEAVILEAQRIYLLCFEKLVPPG